VASQAVNSVGGNAHGGDKAMKNGTMGLLAGVIGCALVAAAPASADVWYFETPLNEGQHNPPTGSQATGWATLKYDDVTHKLDADVYFEGIAQNDLLYAHLHLGQWGHYGDMVVHLGMGMDFMPEGNGLHRTATGLDVDPMFDEAITTEGTYVNIHTVQFPAGEIRGQAIVVPRLSTTDLARGRQATISVMRAQPGDRAYFLYSRAGLGDGPVIGALGGLKLDLLAPVILGSANVNQSGQASLTFEIPANAPPLDVALQAALRRGTNGADSVKSNTISTAILP